MASSPQKEERNKFHASLLQNFIATKWKTLGTHIERMKNTLECHDFWMEDPVPVLLVLGQGTPTDEQVYAYEGQGRRRME